MRERSLLVNGDLKVLAENSMQWQKLKDDLACVRCSIKSNLKVG